MTLQGQTIAVLESRAAEQVAALVARHGGKALSAPALAEIPVIHPDDMRRWMDTLAATPPAISIFQTGVGTRALLEAAAEAGVRTSLVALIQASTVVVRGPKPTAALRVAGIRIDRSASEPFTTDDVLALLEDVELTGKTVLVQRYGDTNERLMQALAGRGAHAIEVPIYQWTLPTDVAPLHRLFDAVDAGTVDAIVFTSASQVGNLLEVARQAGRETALRRGLATLPVVSIGPVCSAALRAAGIDVRSEASPPKLGHLMAAIAAALSTHPSGA
ncbi:MAG: uroporphyrinogen-III synthase [Burkholderiales bacterium]